MNSSVAIFLEGTLGVDSIQEQTHQYARLLFPRDFRFNCLSVNHYQALVHNDFKAFSPKECLLWIESPQPTYKSDSDYIAHYWASPFTRTTVSAHTFLVVDDLLFKSNPSSPKYSRGRIFESVFRTSPSLCARLLSERLFVGQRCTHMGSDICCFSICISRSSVRWCNSMLRIRLYMSYSLKADVHFRLLRVL